MLPRSVEATLREGAAGLDVEPTDAQLSLLGSYLDMLVRWNTVYNLTSVRDPGQMVVQHLLDSLSVVNPLRRERPGSFRLLDVGSGAGLPGVVIAIMCPLTEVLCVDSVGKKSSFVRQVAAELGLANLGAAHARVESLEGGSFDVVTARAFGTLALLVQLTRRYLAQGGCWMAMKGRRPTEEIAELSAHSIDVFHVEPLQVPGLNAERHLVWMRPAACGGVETVGQAGRL